MRGREFPLGHESLLSIQLTKLERNPARSKTLEMTQTLYISKMPWQEVAGPGEVQSLSYLFATLGNANRKVTNTV